MALACLSIISAILFFTIKKVYDIRGQIDALKNTRIIYSDQSTFGYHSAKIDRVPSYEQKLL